MLDKDIENVVKLDIDDGDIVLVTLPEFVDEMPSEKQKEFLITVQRGFMDALGEKEARVVVMPFGMKVEVLPSSMLKDKE